LSRTWTTLKGPGAFNQRSASIYLNRKISFPDDYNFLKPGNHSRELKTGENKKGQGAGNIPN